MFFLIAIFYLGFQNTVVVYKYWNTFSNIKGDNNIEIEYHCYIYKVSAVSFVSLKNKVIVSILNFINLLEKHIQHIFSFIIY